MKSRLAEQADIIREQDALLRATIFAPEREAAWNKEQDEVRRLSMRVEKEDDKRREMEGVVRKNSNAANTMASPLSMKILGGHSAANLPVFATPIFAKKTISHSTAAALDASTVGVVASSIVPASSRSKWLQGGVLTTPTFTPSKRSTIRPGATSADMDLSAIEFDEDEFEDLDAQDDEEEEESLQPTSLNLDQPIEASQ